MAGQYSFLHPGVNGRSWDFIFSDIFFVFQEIHKVGGVCVFGIWWVQFVLDIFFVFQEIHNFGGVCVFGIWWEQLRG